jgi:hypothetical protein
VAVVFAVTGLRGVQALDIGATIFVIRNLCNSPKNGVFWDVTPCGSL